MRPFGSGVLVAVLVGVAALAGCAGQSVVAPQSSAPIERSTRPLGAAPSPTPIRLKSGTTVGTVTWPDGDTTRGGQGQQIDNTLGCHAELLNKFHHHAHLSIFLDGLQLTVPRAIGMYLPGNGQNGFIYRAKCMYYLHAHDRTGIIHMEPPIEQALTLKNYFDLWGQWLNPTQIADYKGNVAVYVNGTLLPGQDPRTVTLLPFEQITLVIGMPPVWIPSYVFPLGYP